MERGMAGRQAGAWIYSQLSCDFVVCLVANSRRHSDDLSANDLGFLVNAAGKL